MTSSSSRSGGTTRFTNPQRSAVRASTRSPVRSISIACLRDRLRATPTPGVVQKRPLLIPGSANCATSLATARSHIETSWQPAATATPCTRATTGCGRWIRLSIMRLQASNNDDCHASSGCARISRRSCPAQKCLPAPARTTARTVPSVPSRSNSDSSAAIMAVESGLSRSPRFIVSVATPSASLRSTYGASISVVPGAFMARRLSLLDRGGRLGPLAKRELLDLPGRGLRQWPEDDRLRRLEPREVRAAMRDDLGFGHARVGFQLDERAGALAPLRIGLRDDCGREHRRMPVEHVLDLERGNVLSARDDDVLCAILDLDVAVRLHHRQIPGVEPAAGERLRGSGRVLQVALHRDVAAEHDLA